MLSANIGPYYKNRPAIDEIWQNGCFKFKIKGFHFYNYKELVIIECVDAIEDDDIGRRTFEGVNKFNNIYWRKMVS